MSVFWEQGYPDFPACGLRGGSSGGPVQPCFISSSSRPSRGAKPHRAGDRKLPQEQPHQAGSRGGGEIKARAPRDEPVTQAMTIETRQAPGGRRPAHCPCFPFGAKGASARKGIGQRQPFRGNKAKTRRTAPAWSRSSWLASRAPRKAPYLDLSASSRACLARPSLRKAFIVRSARPGPSRGS